MAASLARRRRSQASQPPLSLADGRGCDRTVGVDRPTSACRGRAWSPSTCAAPIARCAARCFTGRTGSGRGTSTSNGRGAPVLGRCAERDRRRRPPGVRPVIRAGCVPVARRSAVSPVIPPDVGRSSASRPCRGWCGCDRGVITNSGSWPSITSERFRPAAAVNGCRDRSRRRRCAPIARCRRARSRCTGPAARSR